MTVSILWVDQKQGKLFLISDERMKREIFQISSCHSSLHCSKQVPSHDLTRQLEREQGSEAVSSFSGGITCEDRHRLKFFKTLSLSLKEEKKILIVGPGVAKDQFYQYLKDKEPEIAKKVLGCENLEYSTDAHIAAYAMSHLKAIPE